MKKIIKTKVIFGLASNKKIAKLAKKQRYITHNLEINQQSKPTQN